MDLQQVMMCAAETEQGVARAILKGYIDFERHPWPTISSSAKELVRRMLTQDPKERITSAQVLGTYLLVVIFRVTYFVINLMKIWCQAAFGIFPNPLFTFIIVFISNALFYRF